MLKALGANKVLLDIFKSDPAHGALGNVEI